MNTQRTSIPPNDLASLSRWSSRTTLVSIATNRRSMKSIIPKSKDEDISYTEKPSSSAFHEAYPNKQTQKSNVERLLGACRAGAAQVTSSRMPVDKEFTKGAEDGRPLKRIKTKFLAAITCGCGKDIINEDETTMPAEGDPGISLPWNVQHHIHYEQGGVLVDHDYVLFEQEPPIVALKRLRSWGIRSHVDDTHLRHLEQVLQAGTSAHRRRLEPSDTDTTAADDSLQLHGLEQLEVDGMEAPPAYTYWVG